MNWTSQSIRGPRGGRAFTAAAWALFLSCLLIAAAIADAAAATGAERLKDYLKGLRTLSARFDQITLSSDGGRMTESTGTLYLKRPGKFRWEYDKPMEQVIVADGERVWLHDLELDQVSHQSQGKALSGTPAQLLAADEPIERHFKISPWDNGDEREWVELQPKAKDADVVKIRIGFIGDRLDTLLMEDSFSQLTRFTFTKTKRNPRLDDTLFELKKSPGGNFLRFD